MPRLSNDPVIGAAASVLAGLKSNDDNKEKRAKKEQKKAVMDALTSKIQARKDSARKKFFCDPMEKIKHDIPFSVRAPVEGAIMRGLAEGADIHPSLIINPDALLQDPLFMPPPMVAPVEDDSELLNWATEQEIDEDIEANDNDVNDFAYYDELGVDKPKPGEEKQLGDYGKGKRKRAICKNKSKKKTITLAGTINIKTKYD
jgi:hypothetical protein